MDPKKTQPSETDQIPVAVAALIEQHPEPKVDTSTAAWAAFDRLMTNELKSLEVRFRQYLTPRAVRHSLGR